MTPAIVENRSSTAATPFPDDISQPRGQGVDGFSLEGLDWAGPELEGLDWTDPELKDLKDFEKKMRSLWDTYGWESQCPLQPLLENYPDFLHFLEQSRLLFSIRGYQHCCLKEDLQGSELSQGIRLNLDQHPMIYKGGQWVRWKDIQDNLTLNESRVIVSKDAPSQEWTYRFPDGLAQTSRYNQIFPVCKLSLKQMEILREHTSIPRLGQEREPQGSSYLQIFTTGPQKISHVGVRLIQSSGEVYTFGFETPGDEVALNKISRNQMLATYNVGISSLDFTEFNQFDQRRVTTLSITEEQFGLALDRIKGYANTPLRFNFFHQNCALFAADILHTVGVSIEVRATVLGTLMDFLLPQKIAFYARKFFDWLGQNCPKPILFLARTVCYIPNELLVFIRNSVICLFGAAHVGSTSPYSEAENTRENDKRLTHFHRLVQSFWDLFKSDIGEISSSLRVVHWQMAQPTTYVHKYDGSPKFYIVPPPSAEASLG